MENNSKKTETNMIFSSGFRNQCYGCEACKNICPKQAISMEENSEGFLEPILDESKCIHCHLCERSCPALSIIENPNSSLPVPDVFAAINLNEQIRLESSSGGLFSLFAEKILEEHGSVFGVAFTKDLFCTHIEARQVLDLVPMRGSKYVQASPQLVYKKIKERLDSGYKVLFSGTPCQVAALYGFLGKNSRIVNLVTIDFSCSGAMSPKVFKKYISEISGAQGKVDSFCFRNKRNGWHKYAFTFKTKIEQHQRYVLHFDSPYMKIFSRRLCLRPTCETCQYSKIPRIADITIADYWGIERLHPEMDDDKGTSLLLINTEVGRNLWNNFANDKVKKLKTNLDEIRSFNPRTFGLGGKSSPDREKFFADLDTHSLTWLAKKYCKKKPLLKRIVGRLKRMSGI